MRIVAGSSVFLGGTALTVEPCTLPEVKLIKPRSFGDARGEFFEAYNARSFAELGLPVDWKQDNVSHSKQGVIRGLHLQFPNPQAKLIWVAEGVVIDFAVDVRLDSAQFGQFFGVELSANNHHQLLIPAGFAHGFQVLSPHATVCYKCTAFYSPRDEITIRWDDPRIAIPWQTDFDPIISEKDQAGRLLTDFLPGELPLKGTVA